MGTSHMVWFNTSIFLLPIVLTAVLTTKERQGEALVNWKNSLASSYSLNSWSIANSANLCNWTGIVCNFQGTVSEIDLFENNLTGTLANFSFTSFPNLTRFIIDSNRFTGPIPPEIENLKELTYLDFTNNSLSGLIPYQLSSLQKLRSLYLGFNDLKAPDWSNFLAMPFLSELSFWDNKIASKFPDFITNCRNLTYLVLDNNKFTGSISKDIGLLRGLKEISLHNNSFDGSIPSTIGQLRELQRLDIGINHLNSSIPSELGLCTKLEYLDLSTNNLTGTIPSTIGNLTLLQTLVLEYNQLNGSLPETISKLNKLRGLYLHDNMFSSSILRDFGKNMLSLAFVDLSNNYFSGDTSAAFGVNPNITYIDLSGNQFSGELSPALCKATSLQILDLSSNSLSGSLPHCLGNFSNELTVLNLHNNLFRGTIPATFTTNCQLRTLNMNNNHFEGSVPQALANCKQLQILDMGNNDLSDTFPLWLVTLPELQVLVLRSNRLYGIVSSINTEHPFPKLRIIDLSHNEFTGHLPIQYFSNFKPAMASDLFVGHAQVYYVVSVSLSLKGARYEVKQVLYIYTGIDLSSNKFQGEVPVIIGQLNSLKLLNLSHNSLTGAIPSLLGNMTALESLDLSSNQLTGAIPRQLTRLTFLAVLNLSENHLTGSIPQGGQFNTFNNDSYQGNSALCGFPLTKKCRNKATSTYEVVDDDKDDEEDNSFNWKVILMGYGSGLICGLSTGYIIFSTRRPRWFMKYIEIAQQRLRRKSDNYFVSRRRRT